MKILIVHARICAELRIVLFNTNLKVFLKFNTPYNLSGKINYIFHTKLAYLCSKKSFLLGIQMTMPT
jgi:hypothetical protein